MMEYFKSFNDGLNSLVNPYEVRDSNKKLSIINSEVNKSFYEMNGPHLKNKSNSNIISENLNNYYYFFM